MSRTTVSTTQPWLGSIRLVAIYDRALTPAEVTQNFTAGPDLPLVSAGPDRATQGLPGQPTQSVTLGGCGTRRAFRGGELVRALRAGWTGS